MKPYKLKKESKAILNSKTLHYCLKQLEFLSGFEAHLQTNNNYSIEFLQSLDNIKYQAQLKAINAINYYENL